MLKHTVLLVNGVHEATKYAILINKKVTVIQDSVISDYV